MKKTLAILLTVLVLFSAFSVQSFAILGFDKIESVEVVSLEQFSLQAIHNYMDSFEEEELIEYGREYWLSGSFDVTISTGETINVPDDDYGYSQNGKRIADAYAYVDVYEVIEAAENGSNTVPLYIDTYLYSSIDVELDTKTFTSEVSFPERFVKSLTLVSGDIKFYEYDYGYYYDDEWSDPDYLAADLDKLCFDIVYEDGTKVRADVEKRIEWPVDPEYYLDGEIIFIYPDTETKAKDVKVEFYDYAANLPAKISACPFESITIDDATFDDDFNEETITITVTDTKGNDKSYTKKLENYTEIVFPGYEEITRVYDLGKLYGMPVLVGVSDSIEYGSEDGGISLDRDFELTVDGETFAREYFLGDEIEMTLFERIIRLFRAFIYRLLYMFG